jgi:hypothetical protein
LDTNNLNPNTEPTQTISIEKIIGYKPTAFSWFKGSSSIIIEHENLLSELILSNEKMILINYTPGMKPIYAVNGESIIFYSHKDQKLLKYIDETKTEIQLENIKLPSITNIVAIDLENTYSLILESDYSFYYLNIIDSFLELIDENIEPIHFFRDGSTLLFQKESDLYSYKVKKDPVSKEYSSTRNIVWDEYNQATVQFLPNSRSSHILALEETEENKKIYIIDKNGENRINIFENNRIIPESFYMTSDNKELFLLLNDADQTESSTKQNNLYMLKLDRQI